MGVLIAELICSDEDCAELTELVVSHEIELDAAACDCGCTFVVLSVSAWTPADVRLLDLLAA
jgi:hypothetical protein